MRTASHSVTATAAVFISILPISAEAAGISVDCSYTKSKTTAFCVATDNDDGSQILTRCDKHKDGTWSCVQIPTIAKISTSLRNGVNKVLGQQRTRRHMKH